ARVGAGAGRIPSAPFIHRQDQFLLRVVAIHDGAVLADQAVHPQRVLQYLRIALLVEAHRDVLVVPVEYGVVVQRDALDVPAPLAVLPGLHHGLGPLREARIASAWTHGDAQHAVRAFLLRRVVVAREARVHLHLV